MRTGRGRRGSLLSRSVEGLRAFYTRVCFWFCCFWNVIFYSQTGRNVSCGMGPGASHCHFNVTTRSSVNEWYQVHFTHSVPASQTNPSIPDFPCTSNILLPIILIKNQSPNLNTLPRYLILPLLVNKRTMRHPSRPAIRLTIKTLN